ncbi:MAG: energy transducer TonB [Bacteroidia bacterium]
MDEALKHKIFSETDCLSEQTMFDYIDKKLSERENHIVEKHLLHCDLCSDAIEGLEVVKDRNRISLINQKVMEAVSPPLKETKVVGFNYRVVLSVAASLLLLMGGIFLFNMFNQKGEMAVLKTDQTVVTEPPPPPPIDSSEPIGGSSTSEKIPQAENIVEDARPEDYKAGRNQNTIADELPKTPMPKSELAANEPYVGNNGILSTEPAPIAYGTKDAPEGAVRQEEITSTKYTRTKDVDDLEQNQESDLAGGAKNDNMPGAYPYKEAENKRAANKPNAGNADGDNNNAFIETTATDKQSSRSGALEKAKKKADDGRKLEKQAATTAQAPQEVSLAEDAVMPSTSTTASANYFEQKPEYPGGQDSLISFIQSKFDPQLLTKYPQAATETAEVKFTVDKKGKIKNPTIEKGINPEVDKELLRVLKLFPSWSPATANGEAVSKEVHLPIRLKK